MEEGFAMDVEAIIRAVSTHFSVSLIFRQIYTGYLLGFNICQNSLFQVFRRERAHIEFVIPCIHIFQRGLE